LLSRICSHDVKCSSSLMENIVVETTSMLILVTKHSVAGDTLLFMLTDEQKLTVCLLFIIICVFSYVRDRNYSE